jgi:hypothetical protein
MRFTIGVIVGAIGAAIAHHTGQSTAVVFVVGFGLGIAVWCRLLDAGWDLICMALGWDD